MKTAKFYCNHFTDTSLKIVGAFVVMIIWQLDLQIPMQSVPITTSVVSSNPTEGWCTLYNIM